jgi:hypothetical protein
VRALPLNPSSKRNVLILFRLVKKMKFNIASESTGHIRIIEDVVDE